jgi:hypothetical protein
MGFLTDEQKAKLNNFVKFTKDHLGLKQPPKVVLQNGRKDLKTTANYDYTNSEKTIRINAKNRMLVDVMRSIAHEMVHHRQFEQGKLSVRPPDIGGEIEDEANAVAGQIIKLFAKEDQTIYDE